MESLTVLGHGSYGKILKVPSKNSVYKMMYDSTASTPARYFESLPEVDVHFRLVSSHLLPGLSIQSQLGVGIELPMCDDFSRLLESNLSFDQRVHSMHQLCIAVAEIQRAGFLHLDIKPNNCLYAYVNDQLHVYLADYGGSYHCEDIYVGYAMSEVRGTLGFRAPECMPRDLSSNSYVDVTMAPEAAHHIYTYTDRFDVWSLGMVFLYILQPDVQQIQAPCYLKYNDTRRFYQEWLSESNRLSNIQATLAKQWTHVPEGLSELISNMLHLDSSKRWSIDQVLNSSFWGFRAPIVITELPPLETRSDFSLSRHSGLLFIIHSFQGPYAEFYVKDLFLCIDLYMRLLHYLPLELHSGQLERLTFVCLRIAIRYYYATLKLPVELQRENLIELEIKVLQQLQGRIRTTNLYDVTSSLSECQQIIFLLRSSPSYFANYHQEKLASRQAETQINKAVSCARFFDK